MSRWHVRTADAATGKWRGILLDLGVPAEMLVNRHGPCPMCGGKDRFRFDNKEGSGSFICSHCGGGDGMRLAELFTGKAFAEVASDIDRIVGNLKPDVPGKPDLGPEEMARAIREVAALCQPVAEGDLVSRYLASRGICGPVPDVLRFASRLRDGEGGVRPAMVASVRDASGKAVTLHRTFLRPDGGAKAEMATPRKLMPGPLPDVIAVRLAPAGETLGVAEGIETALAASIMSGLPVWACLTAGFMAKFVPPEGVRCVVVFADDDTSFTGQTAAYTLARRLVAKKLDAQVRVAGEPFRLPRNRDWNDVLREMKEPA